MIDNSGFYQLSGLTAGNYTVIPQKTGDSNGINSQDAAHIQQYLVGLISFTANQSVAADVNNVRVSEVVVGNNYFLNAASKQYQFVMPIQTVNVNNELTDIDFTAQRC